MKLVYTRREPPQPEDWISREYLLTDGQGGYASATLADCLTRKYHGLLALPEPLSGKTILYLSKIELSLLTGTHQYDFSTNCFPGKIFPDGYAHIRSVEIDQGPVSVFTAQDDAYVLSKSIHMPRGGQCVLLRYELLECPKPATLKLMPFLAYRDIHGLIRQNASLRPRTYFEPNGFKVDPYKHLPPLFMQTSKTSIFFPSPDWWNNFEYPEERSRGYDFTEDLFSPGVFEVKLKKGESVILRAGLTSLDPKKISTAWDAETLRITRDTRSFLKDEEPLTTLKAEASRFVTEKPVGILAGFPWFATVWGRDAMISLPGLLLATGRHAEACDLLTTYGGLEKDGLLPNIISPTGDHAYNSLDTPFLYFRAARFYLDATGDRRGVETNILPVLTRILKALKDGRTPNARIGEDGLLYGGNERTQLTWMDAVSRGRPVTPRHGAAVEINALYCRALEFILEDWGDSLTAEDRNGFSRLLERISASFQPAFWNGEDGCLHDVYRTPTDRDSGIRPNQLFALTLPETILSREHARQALETIKLHLVTPYGLRTLSPRHPNFIPSYRGNQDERDAAYHQGLVWPWLIGVYADATLALLPDKEAAKKYLRSTFSPLWGEHLEEGCVRQVAEIFTPLPPHRACGCPAQAWSLAEAIRVLTASA